MKSMLKYTVIGWLLFLFISGVHPAYATRNSTIGGQIKQKIRAYYQQQFSVPEEDLTITYLRFPEKLPSATRVNSIQIIDQHQTVRLGYRTLWVQLLSNSLLVKKMPVSVKVALKKNVLVARSSIKRGMAFQPDMVRFEKVVIDRDLQEYVFSCEQLQGTEATRTIRSGRIIKRDMFQPATLIHRGEKVEIEIKTGNLVVQTEGIAKTAGSLGQWITVHSIPTGKALKAKVAARGLVCIEQRNTL